MLKLKINMEVCILGNGLTSLTLAKALVNQGIYVDIISTNNNKQIDKSRTIGISKKNINFFNKYILNIKRFLWDINKIEIYSESLNNEKILNFKNNEKLFCIIKNKKLFDYLLSKLKKDKLCKFKNIKIISDLILKDYKLIIDCDFNNSITKKLFHRQLKKNYNSYAYTTTIKHEKISNNIAKQFFTLRGPLAFLPISETETSVVYSVKGKKKIDLENLIRKYNNKYKIISIDPFSHVELKSSNLRSYYYKNILAFGDLLHKIHPLAGQGFNMTHRDIKEIFYLIKSRKDNGLDLDCSICSDFEKNMKHKNYLFSNSIDFIYEFFSFENKIKNNLLSKSVKLLGKNKVINNFFTKVADDGIVI